MSTAATTTPQPSRQPGRRRSSSPEPTGSGSSWRTTTTPQSPGRSVRRLSSSSSKSRARGGLKNDPDIVPVETGVVDHDYVSGAADAAYYVGECRPCRATIAHVVARLSAVGYSGTNATGVTIRDSLWDRRHRRPAEQFRERGAAATGAADDRPEPDRRKWPRA